MKIADIKDSVVESNLLVAVPSYQHEWDFSPRELFNDWLVYTGIIGFDSSITAAYRSIHTEVFVVTYINKAYETVLVGIYYTDEGARRAVEAHDDPTNCKIDIQEIKP